MECKQYLIDGKRRRIFELYESYHKRFLEDFLLEDCKAWAATRSFVTDEVAWRLLSIHRVEVGKDKRAIFARYD